MNSKSDAQPDHDQQLEWGGGYAAWLPERGLPVHRTGYTLLDLVRRGLLDADAVEAFQDETLLQDFAWRMLWANGAEQPEFESVVDALRDADGFVIFIHGWDGSGEIWEDLPASIVMHNPRLIALVPDVNGFGGTSFSTPEPPIEKCSPPAIMAAIERWLTLLGLRTPAGAGKTRPFVFVGHSMGGASLFFLDDAMWREDEAGRIAAAPALLLNDPQRQGFYRALGAGIQLSGKADLLDRITENLLAPRLIEALAGWGSERVLAEHHRIYKMTPEGVSASTFAAMGMLDADFDGREWPDFHIYVAHRDRLVGLQQMLDLLEELRFVPEQIRVVLGDHYFFSLGERADLHAKNRELLMQDILDMAGSLISR